MPSQRKAGKKLVGFFATEEEAALLMAAAKQSGLTVADFIRRAIREAPVSSEPKKPSEKKK